MVNSDSFLYHTFLNLQHLPILLQNLKYLWNLLNPQTLLRIMVFHNFVDYEYLTKMRP